MAPTTLLLVDDSSIVRQGLRAVFAEAAKDSITVIGEAGSCAEAIALCTTHKPNVVLLDVRLPDGSGISICNQIAAVSPKTAVIVLTSYSDDSLVYDAVTAGAQGYLLKEVEPSRLVEAVRDVAAGHAILDVDATSAVVRSLRGGPPKSTGTLSTLSGQQVRVLTLVANGLTNRSIAQNLKLSENTVRNYIVSIFAKLEVQTRTEAAALYLRNTPANQPMGAERRS
jgi:two-component system, NarL family, response regulator DevR